MDLTLPHAAPEVERHRATSSFGLPFALYTGIPMSSTELEALQRRCVSMLEEGMEDEVAIPPKAHFEGRPLRAVYDYHLQFGREGNFHPTLFIVVTTIEWETEGVLVVGLDTAFGDCPDAVVDTCVLMAEETGIDLVNLELGKISFGDIQENKLIEIKKAAAWHVPAPRPEPPNVRL